MESNVFTFLSCDYNYALLPDILKQFYFGNEQLALCCDVILRPRPWESGPKGLWVCKEGFKPNNTDHLEGVRKIFYLYFLAYFRWTDNWWWTSRWMSFSWDNIYTSFLMHCHDFFHSHCAVLRAGGLACLKDVRSRVLCLVLWCVFVTPVPAISVWSILSASKVNTNFVVKSWRYTVCSFHNIWIMLYSHNIVN